jgi:hypothetical protein
MGKRTRYTKPKDKETSWFKRQNPSRPDRNITIKNTFLIYCEGENTEPEYFKSFPVTTETKVEAIGLGMSRKALVERVIKLIATIEKDEDRQIWVVFDRDIRYENQEQDNQDFNNAIYLANKNDINCAYSNDCFELWFLLHYNYLESELHRKEIYSKLSEKLGYNYEKAGKDKKSAKNLYNEFLAKISTAIKNAKRLHTEQSEKDYHLQNPCTTVYQLVEELNKNIRK